MMLRGIRRLALVSIALAVVFDSTLYLGLAATLPLNRFAYIASFRFVFNTTFLLCFVTGVLTLVPAAQKRQRGWFAALLVSLVIAGYGPLAVQTYVELLSVSYQPGSSAEEIATIYFFSTYIAPEVPAVVAFLYTLFTQSRPARIPHSDDTLQVEITSLRTPEHTQ